ncbi:MAG: C_GCAxxG_C_C family protein [Chloroflexi bacterium]|nr:C_GCAxxG_C_C family protein [Chloroflexota bacterium]
MNDVIQKVELLFGQGYACSQAVLAAFAPALGLPQETALRIAAPFGGGIARQGKTCGAVSGELMVIGLRFADPQADAQAKDRLYDMGRQFIHRFERLHQATECNVLIGCNMAEPAERQAARERGVFKTLCPCLVRDAASILVEMGVTAGRT